MVLARLRRCAWVLVLVLLTGSSLPLLAATGPGHRHAAAAHVHADGTAHRHGVPDGAPDGAQPAPTGLQAASQQRCPCCLSAADCALSCFGVALLPTLAEWSPVPAPASWTAAAAPAQPGVAPPGAIDPPRPVAFG